MEDFISTRASQNIQNADKLHSLVTFESYKRANSAKAIKKKENENLTKDMEQDNSDEEEDLNDKRKNERLSQEAEMKRFRYDVIKFGMSGLKKLDAKKAKEELAINLGAKPPKNKRKNYKKLKEERKIEKAQQANKLKFATGFNAIKLKMKHKKNVKSNSHKNQGKKSNGILEVYGKVGKNKAYKKKK